MFDGFSFDGFPPFEYGRCSTEVDVSGRQVVQTLVVAAVVVVLDELADALFKLSWQIVVFQQDSFFATKLSNADLTAKALQHNADLLFRRMMQHRT